MFSTADTIVAIATPPGRGGIGIVRLSGPCAQPVATALIDRQRPLLPRRATFARLHNGSDHVVVTAFPAPQSYTGDDVVELSAHGSPVVLDGIVKAAIARGARLAQPGEFTLRAFLNGRIDLMQAEAVADLIDAATPLQARAAYDQLEGTLTRTIAAVDAALFDLIARLEASVDFPEEGYHFVEPAELAGAIGVLCERAGAILADASRGRLIREGLQVVIVGLPNAGKSSLFNALAGAARAIVTDVPGTTRDLVTETVDVEGLCVTLVDTAGLRESTDRVEAEGVDRARQAMAVADLVLHVVDATAGGIDDCHDSAGRRRIIVRNKADLVDAATIDRSGDLESVAVSARTGSGLDVLRREMLRVLDVDVLRERPALTNARHAAIVSRAHAALIRARDAAAQAQGAMSEEFVLSDLQEARAAFEEIAGRRASEDLLAHIFSRFCIGK